MRNLTPGRNGQIDGSRNAAYVICYIDRENVRFASLQMNKAAGIDPKTYGLGAGIFFIGYLILEVPGNLAPERLGARKWIARIMITWGLVSGAFALIGGPTGFVVLRFLLGAAEASLARINALGNPPGDFFNYMIGWIKDETGSYPLAIMPIAIVATIGTIGVLTIGRDLPRTVAMRS